MQLYFSGHTILTRFDVTPDVGLRHIHTVHFITWPMSAIGQKLPLDVPPKAVTMGLSEI